MTSKKTIKTKSKKLSVCTSVRKHGVANPQKSEDSLSDSEFDKHLKSYMKEKKSMMKNLSKR